MSANANSPVLTLELGRRYHFSASHRLHTAHLSEEENCRVFGKCNNPFGHGHNYVLEVSVSGKVDPATGMIANLADLDSFVEGAVLQVFDHKSLNEDVPAFQEKVPTTENLCIDIYERLKSFSHAKLERVRIEETRNNSFEYAGRELARVPVASAAKKELR
ncbi:MAG TPA: 6-carboxytetrahydropterin synthase [Candidatus Acidoferrum sp.]|jgi:6-pyruvoyltetrahydropterin/6-carboxytetrahydropterin synthase|nr:6-carboxytetrahydropterin synthase [Candidatus Acidoferrum sp.]